MAKKASVTSLGDIGGYFFNGDISFFEKFLVVGVVALYFLSPIDVIPDFIPLVGWLDDIGFGAAMAAFCAWRNQKVLARKEELRLAAEQKAEAERQAPGASGASNPRRTTTWEDGSEVIDAEIVHEEENFFQRRRDSRKKRDDDIFH